MAIRLSIRHTSSKNRIMTEEPDRSYSRSSISSPHAYIRPWSTDSFIFSRASRLLDVAISGDSELNGSFAIRVVCFLMSVQRRRAIKVRSTCGVQFRSLSSAMPPLQAASRRLNVVQSISPIPEETDLALTVHEEKSSADVSVESLVAEDSNTGPGGLSVDEDAAGGMGRHLGVFTCTLLIVGCIIGTGIFSTPASILVSVGSVGASLMVWLVGFFLSFCGLFIWLEFGTMFPRSGGEKVYLEAVYKRPRYLATVVFAANAILLGFTADGCLVFAQNIVIAAGHDASLWTLRGIGLGALFFVTFLHGLTPRLGIYLMNILSLFKIVILLFIVVTGWVVLSGKTRIKDPHANFRDAFAGSSRSSNDYATAMFKVLYAYEGWNNVNYVLNEVKTPVRTLKIAGPLGLAITSALYMFANIAFFAVATKEEILDSGVTVASLFFNNVFGETAQKALTVFIALSIHLCHTSNVITVTFSSARIIQELAKEGIPLPFGNRFWASNWPTGKSPLPGLIVLLIPSVIVLLAPPPNVAYPFILDIQGYPLQIIDLFVIIGLFYLRWKKPELPRPFKVWWPLAVLFLASNVILLVIPFLRPPGGVGDTPPLPYYLYCLVGIGIVFAGVAYWAVWRVVLPHVFGFELVPRKEKLEDGTVVTLFSRQKVE
ncbi:high affinity methionine permease [Artomyces pyxidatus]|uniref:High affinity methionine permease n=1 Tax=Artomyces pyxidatus TaxID=48021 RepID=A0ACB8T4Q5_9AGAM|nr:high affinity methionine permease [Artomyces pyxidatus]